MLPAVLGTAAGAAAVTAGRGAAAALGNGLSFVAELAKSASGTAERAPAAEAGDSLAGALKQRIAELTERIRRQLVTAGVRLMQPVELVGDGLGGIAVAGSHPQKADIERAIGGDVLLERDFARLAREYAGIASQYGADGWPEALTISLTESSMGETTGRLPTGK
jgi:hypothetical protein